MNNLFDILEVCLQELENGAELEEVLARYPDMAAELRPLLQVSLTAKLAAIPAPASDILNRNQAKVFQRFDQVWDAKHVTTSWFPSSRWMVVAFVLLIMFFVSGTSLVRASFNSLPGDSLYPVKRSWEKTTLFFTFDLRAREKLELQYDSERLNELDQLFASGRIAQVEFAGVVMRQQGEEWRVANILVIVSARTDLPSQAIQNGNLVRVFGTTKGDGIVFAERVELITASTPIATLVGTQPEIETAVATSQPESDDLGSVPESETPFAHETEIAIPTSTPKIVSFEGSLISMAQSVWKIDTILVEASHAEIIGIPVIGVTVKAEGYFAVDGIFIASRLVIINNELNDNGANSNNDDGSININNDNTNTNDNGHSGNDDSGGGNSGGGGNGGNGNNDNGGGSNGG